MQAADPFSARDTGTQEQYTQFKPLPEQAQLGLAFADACLNDSQHASEVLQATTIALVRRLKSAGLPPERVVIALKESLARYAGAYFHPSLDAEDRALGERESETYRAVLAWCLDAYYGPK